MEGYTPQIYVEVGGRPVAGIFYSRLIKATIRIEGGGQNTDTCTVELDDADNILIAPSKDDDLVVMLGYLETGVLVIGVFKVQSVELAGGDNGERMTIQAKAGDLKNKLKGEGNETHIDKTYGQIVEAAAKRAGMQAVIDPALASIKFPRKVRVGQSEADFLLRLTDEVGGVLKPDQNKIVAVKRGSGKSASGKALDVIIVKKSECKSWTCSPDGRPQFGRTVASYVDQKSGKRQYEIAPTGLTGPDFVVRELAPTKERAKRQAESEAQRLNRNTGSVSFVMYGRPIATAEATIQAKEFRSEITGQWRCTGIEHEFTPGPSGGFDTTIEGKAMEDGTAGGKKKG